MKQQATQEFEKRKSLWWWQSSIHPPYKLSWKKTLVKGPRLYWTGAVTSDKAECNGIGDPRFAEGRGRGWAGAGWLVAGNAPFTQRLSTPSFLDKTHSATRLDDAPPRFATQNIRNCEARKLTCPNTPPQLLQYSPSGQSLRDCKYLCNL